MDRRGPAPHVVSVQVDRARARASERPTDRTDRPTERQTDGRTTGRLDDDAKANEATEKRMGRGDDDALEDGLTSFEDLDALETTARRPMKNPLSVSGLSGRASSVDSLDSASGESGYGGSSSPLNGSVNGSTPMLRSVLTRKPSMAALRLMIDDEEAEAEGFVGREDDDGACSLSEFAMVLNAAAWVRA